MANELARPSQLIRVFYRLSFKSTPGTKQLSVEVAARAGAPKRRRGPGVTPRREAQSEAHLQSGRRCASRRAWGARVLMVGASCPLHG